ncbi:MAG: hypothetical protein QOE96_3282 [Blastocatellia bacterium]|jgi:hypothetical protein|nr:hypothetical protein [Blastocatellia bacterium]
MSKSEFPQPSPQDLIGFRKGDPAAIDRVIRCILAPLCRWGWKEYPSLPQDDVESLVHECLAETARNHDRYDASKSVITTYVINLIKLRVKRLKLNVQRNQALSIETQEKSASGVYNSIDPTDLNYRIMRERFYETVANTLTGTDKSFFDLMRQGAESIEFVKQLRDAGYENPESEAKNRKARVQRRLRDIAKSMGIELQDVME